VQTGVLLLLLLLPGVPAHSLPHPAADVVRVVFAFLIAVVLPNHTACGQLFSRAIWAALSCHAQRHFAQQ
jgi:hypothetical protein